MFDASVDFIARLTLGGKIKGGDTYDIKMRRTISVDGDDVTFGLSLVDPLSFDFTDNTGARTPLNLSITAFGGETTGAFKFGTGQARATLDLTMTATLTQTNQTMTPVPLPAGFPLLLAGLGGFALIRRRAARP